MTDNVINIDDHRPHMTAYVACIECGKDWIAVAPADTLHFECPACSKLSGVVVDPSSPEFIDAFMRPAKYNSAMHGGAGAYNQRIKDAIAEIKGESHE